MKWRCCFLILTLFLSISVKATDLSENFASRTQFESGTAIWNQELGKIHPSLEVINYHGATAVAPKPFDVGDGSHGAFEPSTYAQFSQGGDVSGNKIRLNLSTYPILKVTKFYLATGWSIEPIGSAPLIIYSLTTVRVEGDIHCEGDPGTDAVGATPGTGGGTRCGGAIGGNGGAVGGNGTSGGDISVSVTGGQAGQFAGGAASVGGGGGGSWNTTSPAGAGPDPGTTGAGGAAGLSVTDPEFTHLTGGAGGGGGGGTTTEAGGGGGGGGGVVIIHAVGDVNVGTSPVSATGFIYANGGKGGDSNVGGGPGGGGGGGAIKIFSGGTVNIYNNDGGGASRADQGAGGVNAVPSGGAVGGPGRSWVASVDYHGPGFYSPSEETPVIANNNTVDFVSTAQEIILKSQDLDSTRNTIDSFTFSPVSSDFSVQYRGSSDDFASDDTGWMTSASDVANKRYVKIKLLITSSTPATPTMMDAITWTYTKSEKKEFDLKSSGCGLVDSQKTKPPSGGLLFLFIALLSAPLLLLSKLRSQSGSKSLRQ